MFAGRNRRGVNVDAVGDLHVVHKIDVDLVALPDPQDGSGHRSAVGPGVVLQA